MGRICPICNNEAPLRLTKKSVEYYQCLSCKTLFSDTLDNDNKVGGMMEVERNTQQNHLRLSRIDEVSRGMRNEDVNILDFGCGNGMLIDYLKENGYPNVEGYDAYNERFQTLPKNNYYHVIKAVEVIEHTSKPYIEIDVMWRSLVEGGVVIIETSFVDVAEQEKIPLEEFFYIEPSVGHSTIFSHHGLDLIMALKGFIPMQHFDRNVRLFKKRV